MSVILHNNVHYWGRPLNESLLYTSYCHLQHIGPTSQAASNSNTLESSLVKSDPAPGVCAHRIGNSTLSDSAPHDSESDDWVPSKTEKQVSEKEEEISYYSDVIFANTSSGDPQQSVQ